MPLIGCPPKGQGTSESEAPQSQAIVFPTQLPTLLPWIGSSRAPSPGGRAGAGRGGGGQQQPWKYVSFTVPQQDLCSPPLAQPLAL